MKNRKQGAFAAIITIALFLTGIFFFSGCSSSPKTTTFVQFDVNQAEWSINSTPNYNNFRTLGFVSIETTLTGTKESSGKIAWQGNDITYSGLVEKAKSLNADAVINIVIDTVDTEETIVSGNKVTKVYKRKRIATGLAIKYLEWRALESNTR
jgi:uncharacterized protein YbjQ (UPF0145 family)